MHKLKFLIILIFGFFSLCFAEESITITTYYPSPYGSYRQLTADQIAIGSTYRNPTYADGTLYVQGNVGIGTTTPGAKLEVAGQVKITGGTPAQGKVLTSDANGLANWEAAGGACPSGFNDTGYGYCIQETENSARPWHDASVWCATNFSARLCSASEWVNACVTGKATGMTGNWEYLDSLYDAGGYWCYSLAGLTSCGSMAGVANDTAYPYTFRCCVNK